MGRFMVQADNGDIGSVKFEGGDGNKDILIPKEGGTLATEDFVTNSAEIITAGTGLEKSGTTLSIKYDYLTPIIATGTATFNSTTNTIALAGIGVGIEIGDVIQISGAVDAKNNSEFTVEVINNSGSIIVNQAHAGKGTSKNLATRSSDDGVTIKLLAKWYNAPIGLGQGWVDILSSRVSGTTYTNFTKRSIQVSASGNKMGGTYPYSYLDIYSNGVRVGWSATGPTHVSQDARAFVTAIISNNAKYVVSGLTGTTINLWAELR